MRRPSGGLASAIFPDILASAALRGPLAVLEVTDGKSNSPLSMPKTNQGGRITKQIGNDLAPSCEVEFAGRHAGPFRWDTAQSAPAVTCSAQA